MKVWLVSTYEGVRLKLLEMVEDEQTAKEVVDAMNLARPPVSDVEGPGYGPASFCWTWQDYSARASTARKPRDPFDGRLTTAYVLVTVDDEWHGHTEVSCVFASKALAEVAGGIIDGLDDDAEDGAERYEVVAVPVRPRAVNRP